MRSSRCLAAVRRSAVVGRPVASVGQLASAAPPSPFNLQQLQRRSFSEVAAAPAQTQLGAYLEASGAVWANAAEVHDVVASDEGSSLAWRVDLPPDRLSVMRRGDLLESRPFSLGGVAGDREVRARFQLYPKGDADCKAEGACSLWLCTDSLVSVPVRLRLGSTEREGGASDFCKLEDVLKDGAVEVGFSLGEGLPEATDQEAVQQSLQLTGLQFAEWKLFNVAELFKAGELVSSPPFRFHHVLLGDMYLELLPGTPYEEGCTLFFRCRVPTMKLRVGLAVGENFSKSFDAVGKNTPEQDLKTDQCLQINTQAPGVLGPDGSITVRCLLEEVVTIPPGVRDMIPRLDERASWPKRL